MADTETDALAKAKEMSIMGEKRNEEVRTILAPWFAERFAGFYPPYGWLDLVQEIHEHVVAVAPDYRITQVKEKFGTLCFYVDPRTIPHHVRDACRNYVLAKQEESSGICQSCGAPQAGSVERGWVATLCDACAILDDARGYPLYR